MLGFGYIAEKASGSVPGCANVWRFPGGRDTLKLSMDDPVSFFGAEAESLIRPDYC